MAKSDQELARYFTAGSSIPLLIVFLCRICICQIAIASEISIPIKPRVMTLRSHITLAGRVEYMEFIDLQVAWPTQISKVYVKKGQRVSKDQLLAEIENRHEKFFMDYYLSFQEGLVFQKGLIQEELKFLEKNQKNLLSLVEKGVITLSEVEKVESAQLRAQGALLSANHRIKSVDDEISKRRKQLALSNLSAPFEGIVQNIVVDRDQLVGAFILDPGVTFARIAKPKKYKIRATLPDTEVVHLYVGKGNEPSLKCQVNWAGLGRPVPCDILSIDSHVVKDTRQQRFAFEEAEQTVLPSQPLYQATIGFSYEFDLPEQIMAVVKVEHVSKKSGLAVPWSAITMESDNATLKIFREGAGFVKKIVALGARNDRHVIVENGLSADDVVYARLE